MEKDSEFLDDDKFNLSDFEEELEHVVGVEEILECAIGITNEFAFISTFGKTYFNFLDYEFECEGDEERDEEGDGRWQGVNNDPSHLLTDNTEINIDESSLLLFEQILIEFFLKYVHFIIPNKKLMIEYLEGQLFPTFDQICEADASFHPLSKSYGRFIDVNNVFNTIKR
jgi:hypothetical protein